jgi:hypothetical protein
MGGGGNEHCTNATLQYNMGPLKRLLYSVIWSVAIFDVLPSKSINLLKGLQNDIKYKWIPTHCGIMGNEVVDYLAKKGTKIKHLHVNI